MACSPAADRPRAVAPGVAAGRRAATARGAAILLGWAGQVRAAEDAPLFSWWDLLAPLVIVIGAGAIAWWVVHRSGVRGGTRGGPVRVVQAVPVGTRERLVVVRITEGDRAGERLLVGVTAQRVELIERLGRDTAAAESDPAAPR